MRLIDADALKQEIREAIKHLRNYQGVAVCLKALNDAPTIEAEPVRHGYWEESPTGNKNFNYCSVCEGAIQKYDNETFAYCPHCGARMDGWC